MKDKEGKLPEIAVCVCGGTGVLQFGGCGFFIRCEKDPGETDPIAYKSRRLAIQNWNRRQAQMDSLTIDSVRAYHRGMHYGDYIAVRGPIYQKEEPESEPEEEVPVTVWKLRCQVCGQYLPDEGAVEGCCSQECADRFREMDRTQYLCKVCGGKIPIMSHRSCNCSPACDRISKQIHGRSWRKASTITKAMEKKLAEFPPK